MQGGGTSVVGGIEASDCDAYSGSVCVDLRRMNRVIDVNTTCMTVQVEGGMLGPALEARLGEQGYTCVLMVLSRAWSCVSATCVP